MQNGHEKVNLSHANTNFTQKGGKSELVDLQGKLLSSSSMDTVWKFWFFSATQILREINFDKSDFHFRGF